MARTTLLILLAVTCAAAGPVLLPAGAVAHPQDSAFDADHDGIDDPPLPENDNCAGEDAAYNPAQTDTDLDGFGDACDVDDDGDGVDDAVDNCALISNSAQNDLDGDATGDVCDVDDDGDGLADSRDNCRFVPNRNQADRNGNGIGDACDEASAGAPARPSGGSGPPDEAAPEVELTLRSRHWTSELGAGLAVPVSCSERCVVTSTLRLGAREAKRLALPDRVLGTGGAELDGAGETFVFMSFARGALRRVRKRAVHPVLLVEVADPAGNRRTLRRRLTISP
jgi:Thrombospondin type 3 repeat